MGERERLAVLGNCQAPGLAECLRVLRPGAVVDPYLLSTLRADTPDRQAEIASELGRYDVVFTQPVDFAGLGPLQTPLLRDRVPTLVVVPAISFGGFHPDSVYVDHAGKHVPSAIGPYNSVLVAASYLEKVPVTRVAGLFNAYFWVS